MGYEEKRGSKKSAQDTAASALRCKGKHGNPFSYFWLFGSGFRPVTPFEAGPCGATTPRITLTLMLSPRAAPAPVQVHPRAPVCRALWEPWFSPEPPWSAGFSVTFMAGAQIHVATIESMLGSPLQSFQLSPTSPRRPALLNHAPDPFPAFWESFANPDSHAWAALAAFSGAISAVAGLPLPHLHL